MKRVTVEGVISPITRPPPVTSSRPLSEATVWRRASEMEAVAGDLQDVSGRAHDLAHGAYGALLSEVTQHRRPQRNHRRGADAEYPRQIRSHGSKRWLAS